MINPKAKLAENIFEKPDEKPTRDGFGKGLLELGEINKDVVALCADLAESTRMLAFKEKYPERYIELGRCRAKLGYDRLRLGQLRQDPVYRLVRNLFSRPQQRADPHHHFDKPSAG
jgi:hypothetical protein